MPVGAITGYVDLAQILLYAFWLFFAGLIYYLVREGHREGYPLETEGLSKASVTGWPIPSPKTYKLYGGGEVTIPDPGNLCELQPDFRWPSRTAIRVASR